MSRKHPPIPAFLSMMLLFAAACSLSPQALVEITDTPSSTATSFPTPQPPTSTPTIPVLPTIAAQETMTIVLTKNQPSANAGGELVAPGRGRQSYTLFLIDTSDFNGGGILKFRVTLGTGESDASFDLFPEGVAIPTEGRALESVATLYDLPRGGSGTLSYQFSVGQVFQFGATGNWFSPLGSTNTFSFTVTVE